MTKIIGLTGGIGSGKSTVAKEFFSKGIPVYYADDEAKIIMETAEVQDLLKTTFGSAVFDGAQLNKQKLAQLVFSNSALLEQLNAIVHPRVQEHFKDWLAFHSNHPIVIKEAAILFESGRAADCDYVIAVEAEESERIRRVMHRDNTTKEQVLQRMQHQWTDEMRASKSDFIIQNTSLASLPNQVKSILEWVQKSE